MGIMEVDKEADLSTSVYKEFEISMFQTKLNSYICMITT